MVFFIIFFFFVEEENVPLKDVFRNSESVSGFYFLSLLVTALADVLLCFTLRWLSFRLTFTFNVFDFDRRAQRWPISDVILVIGLDIKIENKIFVDDILCGMLLRQYPKCPLEELETGQRGQVLWDVDDPINLSLLFRADSEIIWKDCWQNKVKGRL